MSNRLKLVHYPDEEISAMRQELEKYGIQMPAFSKIGGILANEVRNMLVLLCNTLLLLICFLGDKNQWPL